MKFIDEHVDVAVIGAGHAGIEAALAAAAWAAARRFSPSISTGWGICPAIPPLAAPPRAIWSENWTPWAGKWARPPTPPCCNPGCSTGGKGPAVHSLRAQIDRRNYSAYMKHRLETTPGLDIRQGEIVRLERLPPASGC